MNPRETELKAIQASPYAGLFGNIGSDNADAYFTHFENYDPTCWSDLVVREMVQGGPVGEGVKNLKFTFKPSFEYDLLTSIVAHFKTPSLAIKEEYAENYRFRFANHLARRISPAAVFGDAATTVYNKRKFSSIALEQVFIPEERCNKNTSNTKERENTVKWDTEKERCKIVSQELWPFSLEPGKALELFRFEDKCMFTYEFDLKVKHHIHIQELVEDEDEEGTYRWTDCKVDTELCEKIFKNFHKKFEVFRLFASLCNITMEEKKKRLQKTHLWIYDTIEFKNKNPISPSDIVELAISNQGLTTLVMYGAENVSGNDMNYIDSFTNDYKNPQRGNIPLEHASLKHCPGVDSYIFQDLSPELLSSELFTRNLNAIPRLPGIFAYSFVRSHEVGEFMGGCYTQGCNSILTCTLASGAKKGRKRDTSKYVFHVSCLLLRKLVFRSDKTYAFDLEKK